MNYTTFAFNHSIKKTVKKKFDLEVENNHICKFTAIKLLKLPNVCKGRKNLSIHLTVLHNRSVCLFVCTYIGVHS